MPRLRITHATQYRYRTPVRLLTHRLMLRPQDSHDLRLHAATLAVDPAPGTTRWAHDVFGNSVCLLEWPEKAPGIFPDNTIHVFIELVDDKTRRLKISNN